LPGAPGAVYLITFTCTPPSASCQQAGWQLELQLAATAPGVSVTVAKK
jgi:hypothetical protein